jgi:hypothetical protein
MFDIRCMAIDKTRLPATANPANHGVEKGWGKIKKPGTRPALDSKRLAYL